MPVKGCQRDPGPGLERRRRRERKKTWEGKSGRRNKGIENLFKLW